MSDVVRVLTDVEKKILGDQFRAAMTAEEELTRERRVLKNYEQLLTAGDPSLQLDMQRGAIVRKPAPPATRPQVPAPAAPAGDAAP